MKKSLKIVVIILIVIAFCVCGFFGYNYYETEQEKAELKELKDKYYTEDTKEAVFNAVLITNIKYNPKDENLDKYIFEDSAVCVLTYRNEKYELLKVTYNEIENSFDFEVLQGLKDLKKGSSKLAKYFEYFTNVLISINNNSDSIFKFLADLSECNKDMAKIMLPIIFPKTERAVYKPVIYLYPTETISATVELNLRHGDFTTTYPKISNTNSWSVIANPNGVLTDESGMEYNYLYWEGVEVIEPIKSGWCIKGEDTSKFLEEKLLELGLNRKEANEFIVFWLPMMEGNNYNLISFDTDEYCKNAELTVTPNPGTLIRVFMRWSGSDKFIKLEEEEIITPIRKGFTVVEWGGSELK